LAHDFYYSTNNGAHANSLDNPKHKMCNNDMDTLQLRIDRD